MIVDYHGRFGARTLAAHAARCPSSNGETTPPAPGVDLSVKAVARVDHSRWIAECPFEGCHGAEYVSTAGQPFFCCECRNAAVAHVPILVDLPGEKVRGQVEAYLVARPVPAARNWRPGETVAQLRDENREHGIRLLKEGD